MVRLLAGMGANVHRERAPLDEALPATLLVASVRSLLGVDAMMSLQIRFAIEALQVNQPSSVLPPVQVRSRSEHERHYSFKEEIWRRLLSRIPTKGRKTAEQIGHWRAAHGRL